MVAMGINKTFSVKMSCYTNLFSRFSLWIPSRGRFSTFILSRDEARKWSRKNERLAREAMSLPTTTIMEPQNMSFNIPFDLEAYLRERCWPGFSDDESSKSSVDHMIVLISQALTYPLTLGFHSQPFFMEGKNDIRLAVLGARSEASLPVAYWREMLYLSDRMNNSSNTNTSPINWTLDFIGPDIAPRLASRFTSLNSSHRHLKLVMNYHNTYFHQHVMDQSNAQSQSIVNRWDGFVLFNPGVGHSNLLQLWKPTLELILQSNKPILITAHSEIDQERDRQTFVDALEEIRGNADGSPQSRFCQFSSSSPILYKSNPFASRMVFEDIIKEKGSNDGPHLVRPNYSVCLL